MIRRIWKPLVFVLLVSVLAVSLYSQVTSLERPSVATGIGELAPDFTGTTLEGNTLTLSNFHGQLALVDNFATWCESCQAETPYLVDVYNAEGGRVLFIGLNHQESEFKNQCDIPYPLAMDPDGMPTDLYRPNGVSTSWFVDSEGVVRYMHAGPMTTSMVQETLDAIRAGREPDCSLS